jgi:tetratricopeptide (TPR) repeat protein
MEPTNADPKDEQELRARIRAGSRAFEDYRALADILLNTPGREDEGLAILVQALDLPLPGPERAGVAADVGWRLYEFGKDEEAIRAAQGALSDIADQAEMSEVLMIRGLSHATLAFSRYPTDPAGSDRDARLALKAFEQYLGQHASPENLVAVCLHAARIHGLRQDYAKAIALYEKAMQAEPSDWNRLNCLIYIGNALRCLRRYTDAGESLREALALVEVDRRRLPMIYFELGKVHRLTNHPEEAVTAFEQALKALDLSPIMRRDRVFVTETRWELGNSYYDVKGYEKAIAAFREALRDLPEVYPYLYCHTLLSLGHCYLATRQYAGARDCYEEVLASEQASREEKETAQEGLSRLPPLPPPTIH